ncbi:leucine-rich repeat domain-containing protein [bacterium c-19]|nr:leucine-rich repeat domain-containing protein [bacterium c-19]
MEKIRMKKIICSFIALIILFTVIDARDLSFSASVLTAHAASPEYVFNDYKYRHVSNGVEITGYIGKASHVYIPSYINGKKVVSIGENAFTLYNITYVKVPEGVTELKPYAFSNCDDLVTIVLPKSLKSIRHSAFFQCRRLKNINIPSDVSHLEGYVFYRCESLTQITIPEGIDIIAGGMFDMCTSLNKVSLPTSLKAIGSLAFDGCTQLKNISIPRGVTTIQEYAFAHSGLTAITIPRFVEANPAVFAGCENLKKISVDPNNKQYTSVNNVLYSKDRKKLYFHPFADVITVSNGVKVIEKEAFKMNKARKIVLPASVVSIKEGAFVMCANLQNVILPYNLKYIGRRVFEACYKLKNITIPASVTTIEDTAFKSIGHVAYYNLDILLSVYSDSIGYEYAMNNGFDYKLLVQEKDVRLK